MKRLHRVTVICCLVYLLAGTSLTFGQKRKASPRSACAAGGIAFKCPKGFKILPPGPDLNLALIFHKDDSLGVFVAVPQSGFDEQEFLSGVLKTASPKFFPKESEVYQWKLSPDDSSVKASKYEVGRGSAKGFNGTLAVYVGYRRVLFKGKDLLVGYIAKDSEGQEAKEFFEGNALASSMVGCDAVVEIIYSITGEKINEADPPCVIITDRPITVGS